MTEEQENERTRSIDANTSVRLPIGLLASFMVAVAVFLFTRQNVIESTIDSRYSEVKTQIETKADKSAASDRYTGKDASHDQKLQAETLNTLRTELMLKIEHLEYIIDALKERHDKDIDRSLFNVDNHRHKNSDILNENKSR